MLKMLLHIAPSMFYPISLIDFCKYVLIVNLMPGELLNKLGQGQLKGVRVRYGEVAPVWTIPQEN